MGTILWKNLSVIPAPQRDELRDKYDELGHLKAGCEPAQAIFVYLRRGGVIEVRPATGVRLTGDTLTVLDGKNVVACYPRERVVEASRQLVEQAPFS